MIKDLQDARMGDPGRLAYIMKRIEDGRSIYNSDEQYVRYKFNYLRGKITSESKDEFEQPDISKNIVTNPKPDTPKDTVTNPKPDTPKDTVTSPQPDLQPTVTPKIANGRHPSKVWYVLPIFLGVLGGLIAYAKLRKRNRSMAYKTLGLGVGITMLFLVPILAASTFEPETGCTVHRRRNKGTSGDYTVRIAHKSE